MNIEFMLASFCLAVLPGPDILFVLTQSVSRGFKPAFFVSLGLVSGLFVHTAAVAVGVAALVAGSPVLLTVLQYLGAAYLGWLGLSGLLRTRASVQRETPAETTAIEADSLGQFYGRGIIMNLLNPKVILFFLSFFPGFIPQNTAHTARAVFELGTVFAGITLCVFSAVSLLGGWVNQKWDINRFASSRVFAWITALLFWGIAGWIVWG